jgi:gliding motility-associated-like protein
LVFQQQSLKRRVMKWIVWIGTSLLPLFANAQVSKRADKWYFGYRAGLDFSSGAPTPVTDGALSTWEGCATMCDDRGNLLFYTDGISVWNKQHALIPNATNLGADSSTTQAATVLPMPGNPSLYYIFSVDYESRQGGVQYAILDMNAAGGLGAVLSKNNRLVTRSTEKFTTVKHCNGKDFWLITHGWDTNEFMAFLLSFNGVSLTPVISRAGMTDTQNAVRGLGYLKASPDDKRLAQGLWRANTFEIFDFNNATGVVSNPITLTDPDFAGAYGVEFSPSGRFLYAATAFSGNVYQFDLQRNTTSNALITSKLLVGKITTRESFKLGALQMAPNGKIYMAINKQTYLGVIENPEVPGTGSNFRQNGIALAGRVSGLGLPNMPAYVFDVKPTVTLAVRKKNPKDCNDQSLLASTNAEKPIFQWFLEKQLVSTGSDSSYKPTLAGRYSVRVIENLPCSADTCHSESVEVKVLKTELLADTIACGKSRISVKTNGFVKWVGASVTDQNRFQQDSITVLGNTSAEYKTLTYPSRTDSSCFVENKVTVPFSTFGKFTYAPQPAPTCEDSILLKITGVDYDRITWTGPGNSFATAPNLVAKKSGIYTVQLANSTTGCKAQDKVNVQLLSRPLPPFIKGPAAVCSNDKPIDLTAVGNEIRWFSDVQLSQLIGTGNTLSVPLNAAKSGEISVYATQKIADGCVSKSEHFSFKVNPAPPTLPTQAKISHCFETASVQPLKVPEVSGWSYAWYEVGNQAVLGNSSELNVTKEGTYFIKTISRENCTATDTLIVIAKCNTLLFVPDSFSPNQDGINDVLQLYGESLTEFEWLIFDRWGNAIYRLQSPTLADAGQQFWNGTHPNGTPALSGVYTWKITIKDATFPNGVHVATGAVLLVR